MTRDFTIWLSTLDSEDLETLRDHGPQGGIPGMIYYRENNELYAKYSQDVWDAVTDYCEQSGFPLSDILMNIIGNGCQSHDEFATNMVWFAATRYVDEAIRLKNHYQSFDKSSED